MMRFAETPAPRDIPRDASAIRHAKPPRTPKERRTAADSLPSRPRAAAGDDQRGEMAGAGSPPWSMRTFAKINANSVLREQLLEGHAWPPQS